MKTQIKKSDGAIVVEVNGKLDFETQQPFKEDLRKIIQQSKTDSVPTQVIFNLKKLEFVGSSGISNFVQTLKDFNQRAGVKPRYCHVGSEFQKIIRAFDEQDEFDFYDTEERARKDYSQNN
ncbi:MAG: STAS domain-containing protein [Bdellovibrionales bacterium]|nr:STAS domain-containing protein [Bdellovibrionales bacterium]